MNRYLTRNNYVNIYRMEIKVEPGMEGMVIPRPVKERKKHDRFNGMSEEEVSRRTLPDHLTENLDIIIVSMIWPLVLFYLYLLFYSSSTNKF